MWIVGSVWFSFPAGPSIFVARTQILVAELPILIARPLILLAAAANKIHLSAGWSHRGMVVDRSGLNY